MRIIADTNIFLAVALNEPEKKEIIRLSAGYELIAPEILFFEIGNALSAMVKRGRLNAEEGMMAYDDIQKIPVGLLNIDIRSALRLAALHNIFAYDAYFLECAAAYRCPLLTLDVAMQRVAKDLNIQLLEKP